MTGNRRGMGTRRRFGLAVSLALIATVFVPGAAEADTGNFSGSVSSSGTSWRAHTFDVQAPATIEATLDWDQPSANLNMFLYDPAGTQVALANSATARPEVITYQAATSGRWKVGIKAKSGSAGYTVSVDGVAPAQPGYLTILFGRSQWSTAINCVPPTGAVNLGQVAAELQGRGFSATGNVVVDRTNESGLYCQQGYALHPSWEQLADLRDTFGWTFISAGATYTAMTGLTTAQQFQESCGSLQAFVDHGHDRAWGLFAYPGNAQTTKIQQDVVSTCFAYGRKYAGNVNVRSTMQPPWFQNTYSVNGGACNDPDLNCFSMSSVGVNRRYAPPNVLLARVTPGSGEWGSVQFYRLVTGSRSTGGQRWDCTSADPQRHWSNKAELYCWSDFTAFLDGLPAGIAVTDPATVADAWGRAPG